jgi:nucleoside-diphosphate-sugar epimerase
MNRLFCFGFGPSAQALARRLKPQGWRIAGTARDRETLQEIAQAGYEAFMFEGTLIDVTRTLDATTHILLSIPPTPRGDVVLERHVHDLAAISPKPKWVGYLSSTVVYGNHGGEWVDETTPTVSDNERAKRRVAAEHAWTAWGAAVGVPVHVFRLAGIYGPGSNQIEALRRGKARRIVKEGQVFSRIHVEDLASVLEASIAQPNAGAIYNVCDDEPAPPQDVVSYAAELLNVAPPPVETFEQAAPTMSDMALSIYSDAKRVRNTRIKSELGVKLRYPNYREGLQAIKAGLN